LWEKIVIDTCALINDKSFFKWLNSYRGSKILPLIAYIEYSIGQRRRGKNQEKIDYLIKKVAQLEIPQFTTKEARYTIEIVSEILDESQGSDFKKNWRDTMIASHAYYAPTLLVTNNVSDFSFLEKRVVTPEEIKKRYRDRM